MWRRLVLVRTDVSLECIASIIRLKRRFLQDPHGVTSQKTAFFIGVLLLVPANVVCSSRILTTNYEVRWRDEDDKMEGGKETEYKKYFGHKKLDIDYNTSEVTFDWLPIAENVKFLFWGPWTYWHKLQDLSHSEHNNEPELNEICCFLVYLTAICPLLCLCSTGCNKTRCSLQIFRKASSRRIELLHRKCNNYWGSMRKPFIRTTINFTKKYLWVTPISGRFRIQIRSCSYNIFIGKFLRDHKKLNLYFVSVLFKIRDFHSGDYWECRLLGCYAVCLF
jgi:hypothetical protein